MSSYRLPSAAEIEAAARRVYDLLNVRQRVAGKPEAERDKLIAEAKAKFPAEAAALSQLLLAPATAQLGKKRLLIVAPGALQYVPFAALPAPKDETAMVKDEKNKLQPSALDYRTRNRQFAVGFRAGCAAARNGWTATGSSNCRRAR